MSNIFGFLAQLLNLLMVLIIIRIILSWVAPQANFYKQPLKTLYIVTDSVMAPFRGLIPPVGGIDFSPMLLFLLLGWLQSWLESMAIRTAVGV